MTYLDPSDRVHQIQLNENDILCPSPVRGGFDDKTAYTRGRDRFMSANPALGYALGTMAELLVLIQEGNVDLPENDFTLPEAVRPPGSQTFILNEDSPYYGIRLTLDHEVKQQTGHDYFVHYVDPSLYERPEPGDDSAVFEHYELLGLVERTDPRSEYEYDPPFALAISADCRRVRVLAKVSDEELARRERATAADKLAYLSHAGGAILLQEYMTELRIDALEQVTGLIRDPRLSSEGEQALIRDEVLGSVESLISLTATQEERNMFGIGPDGETELMVRPVGDITTQQLLAALVLLHQPEAYDL